MAKNFAGIVSTHKEQGISWSEFRAALEVKVDRPVSDIVANDLAVYSDKYGNLGSSNIQLDKIAKLQTKLHDLDSPEHDTDGDVSGYRLLYRSPSANIKATSAVRVDESTETLGCKHLCVGTVQYPDRDATTPGQILASLSPSLSDWVDPVYHDQSLEGKGTQLNPLKVVPSTASTIAIDPINSLAAATVQDALSTLVCCLPQSFVLSFGVVKQPTKKKFHIPNTQHRFGNNGDSINVGLTPFSTKNVYAVTLQEKLIDSKNLQLTILATNLSKQGIPLAGATVQSQVITPPLDVIAAIFISKQLPALDAIHTEVSSQGPQNSPIHLQGGR